MTDTPVSLASLMTPSKTVSVDYPGYTGFSVDLCYLAREELIKVRKKCLSNKWNKRTHQPDDELPFTQENSELLMKNATSFDTWVTDNVGDLENFTGDK